MTYYQYVPLEADLMPILSCKVRMFFKYSFLRWCTPRAHLWAFVARTHRERPKFQNRMTDSLSAHEITPHLGTIYTECMSMISIALLNWSTVTFVIGTMRVRGEHCCDYFRLRSLTFPPKPSEIWTTPRARSSEAVPLGFLLATTA